MSLGRRICGGRAEVLRVFDAVDDHVELIEDTNQRIERASRCAPLRGLGREFAFAREGS